MAWRHHFQQSRDRSGNHGFEGCSAAAASPIASLALAGIHADRFRRPASNRVRRWLTAAGLFALAATLTVQTHGQDAPPSSNYPTIDQFDPESKLIVPVTEIRRASVPAIDVHTHPRFKLKNDAARLTEYVGVMDENNIRACVSLDATLGQEEEHIAWLESAAPGRFIPFAHIDFQGNGRDDEPATWHVNQPSFTHDVCEMLKVAQSNGIRGVKFFKKFGLSYRDAHGDLIRVDDARFDPIWKTCGELRLPILIHVADPAAFFDPIDARNERLEELLRHPDWSFHGEGFPSRGELLDARNRVIARHPSTQFITAHVANNAEDLATVGEWLDQYPNMHVELASRIAELGRQPFTARKFFLKYQDRILFGTDGPWPDQRLDLYWRFLETDDEYFPYAEKTPPPQGFWRIYGVNLPPEVLRKVYFDNARKLVDPGGRRFGAEE